MKFTFKSFANIPTVNIFSNSRISFSFFFILFLFIFFSHHPGKPLNLAMDLVVASFDSISEVNMVSE